MNWQPDKDKLMSEKEVSDYLGLKPRTLQQWRLTGRGPTFMRLSERIIRYRLSDVQAWVENIKKAQNL